MRESRTGTTAGDTGDEQSSLTLSPDQVQQGYKLDGQQTPADGQVASATSSNNCERHHQRLGCSCARSKPDTRRFGL